MTGTVEALRAREKRSSDLSELIAGLANADRRVIMRALIPDDGGPLPALTIMQIARATELSRFAVARHMRVLADAGVVEIAQWGRGNAYRLRPECFAPLENWLYATFDLLDRARSVSA